MRPPGTTRVGRSYCNSLGASLKVGDRLRAQAQRKVRSGQAEVA